METNHTPGPWHVELGGFIYSKDRKVADAGFLATDKSRRTADAYLIASAPDLLECCQLAREICEPGNALQKMLDAAIRRATACDG